MVWLHVRVRDIAVQTASAGQELPSRYGISWLLGGARRARIDLFLAIFFMMVARRMPFFG